MNDSNSTIVISRKSAEDINKEFMTLKKDYTAETGYFKNFKFAAEKTVEMNELIEETKEKEREGFKIGDDLTKENEIEQNKELNEVEDDLTKEEDELEDGLIKEEEDEEEIKNKKDIEKSKADLEIKKDFIVKDTEKGNGYYGKTINENLIDKIEDRVENIDNYLKDENSLSETEIQAIELTDKEFEPLSKSYEDNKYYVHMNTSGGLTSRELSENEVMMMKEANLKYKENDYDQVVAVARAYSSDKKDLELDNSMSRSNNMER